MRQSLERFLLQVVDGCLAGAIFVVPLLMGGRHAIGQLALTVLAVVAGVAWFSRQCLREDAAWRPAGATLLIVLGAAMVVLQAVPLPPWLLAFLSPRRAEILPLWGGGGTPGSLGYWPTLSYTPAETLSGLIIFLDEAILFFVAAQRIARVEDVERLLRWCALSAVTMASFGIVQYLAGNGKFFWFYDAPFTNTFDSVKGSFTNRNHFADFLAIGVGPLLWWLQDAMRRSCEQKRTNGAVYFLGLALGVVLFAGLMSLSRGGIAAIALAVIVAAWLCWRSSSMGRGFGIALAAAAVLIGVSLSIFGLDRVGGRLEDYSSGSLERLDQQAGRRTIWAAALQAIPDHPLFGSGVGSFREIYPLHTNFLVDDNIEFTHAENSYLQVLVENGLIGFGLVLIGMTLCASWCVAGLRASMPTRVRLCSAAVTAGLVAIVAHALVDFVWYVPACTAMVAILAACVFRLKGIGARGEGREKLRRSWLATDHWPQTTLSSNPQSRIPNPSPPASRLPFRVPYFASAAILACLGVWMIAQEIGPAVAQTYWDQYMVARNAAPLQPLTDANVAATIDTLERRIVVLESAVAWQPSHVRAHLALGECHRLLFDALQATSENPMSLANIRDAAIQSRFFSRAALAEWMSRAFGTHWTHLDQSLAHVRRALAICPLEGRAYVYLTELSFLNGASDSARHAYIEQALCVRPQDGSVLYAAATESLMAGNHDRWLALSKRAFRTGRHAQERVLSDLAAGSSETDLPSVVEMVLREYQPDLYAASYLNALCAKRCPPEALATLAAYRAKRVEIEAPTRDAVQAAAAWLEAQRLYTQLGDTQATLRCMANAIKCDPNSFDVHFQSGQTLLKLGKAGDAEPHVRWCLQRKPDNPVLADMLREVLRQQLDGQRRAASNDGGAAAR